MPEHSTRQHFRDELERARGAGPRRRSTSSSSSSTASLEALEHQDVELAEFVIADDDRVDGRYLEVHQGDPLAARAAGAGRDRPAARRRAPARDQARRAHGRPVREHREADPARPATSRRCCRSCWNRSCGWAAPRARRSSQAKCGLPEPRHRPRDRPRAPGPRGQPPQPRGLPPRRRGRRRPRHARVGDAP